MLSSTITSVIDFPLVDASPLDSHLAFARSIARRTSSAARSRDSFQTAGSNVPAPSSPDLVVSARASRSYAS